MTSFSSQPDTCRSLECPRNKTTMARRASTRRRSPWQLWSSIRRATNRDGINLRSSTQTLGPIYCPRSRRRSVNSWGRVATVGCLVEPYAQVRGGPGTPRSGKPARSDSSALREGGEESCAPDVLHVCCLICACTAAACSRLPRHQAARLLGWQSRSHVGALHEAALFRGASFVAGQVCTCKPISQSVRRAGGPFCEDLRGVYHL